MDTPITRTTPSQSDNDLHVEPRERRGVRRKSAFTARNSNV